MLLPILLTVQTLAFQRPQLQFQNIKDGLLSNQTSAIIQDKYGYIWIGTVGGLHRYDGYEFVPYLNSADPKSLPNIRIESLYEDSKGRLWIGTVDGICLYNWDNDNFTRYVTQTTPLKQQNPYPNRVRAVFEDDQKTLWVGSEGEGLFFFDSTRQEFQAFYQPDEPNQLKTNRVTALALESPRKLWVGTVDQGLNLVDLITKEVTNIQDLVADQASTKELNHVFALKKDLDGKLWVGTRKNGLFCITNEKGNTKTVKHYQHVNGNPNSLANNDIFSLFIDQEGQLWVGLENGGLHLYNKAQNSFYRFEHDPSQPFGISHNSISSIYQDKQTRLWIGNLQGVDLYDKYYSKFKSFAQSPNSQGLNNNIVRDFWEDQSGNIWIATDGGGLNYFDRKRNAFSYYMHNRNNPTSISSNAVLSFCKAADGKLWIGTWAGGINILENPSRMTFRSITPTGVPPSYPNRNFFQLLRDHENNIWGANSQTGLSVYDWNTKQFTTFYHEPGNKKSLSSEIITTLLEDHENNIWVGSERNGLNKVMKEPNGEIWFKQYIHSPNDSTTLPSVKINTLFEDHQKNLWIGSEKGLSKYLKATDSFITYDKEHGFSSDDIRSIVEDNSGMLWLGTAYGLIKFNPENRSVRTFNESDGLQGNEFSRYAAKKLQSGELLFGGTNGFNLFHPDRVQNNPHAPEVYITALKIFNKLVKIGDEHSILKRHISHTKHITLNHQQSVFSFRFVALNYTHSEENQFAFKMEGLEENWNYVGRQKNASYSNLAAGKYTFRVKAANSDGIWNEHGASLKITIVPPWWETWWFKSGGVFFLLVAAIVFYKMRTAKLKAQKRKLESLVKARTTEVVQQKDRLQLQNEEIKQQSEELQVQRDYLAKQQSLTQKAYDNIKILSEIGQKITGILDLSALNQTIYRNVNTLMDATAFGIGIYDKKTQQLVFDGFIEKSKPLPNSSISLKDDNELCVWCFKHQKEICINDIQHEVKHYIKGEISTTVGELPQSLIYVPLSLENKKIGVITVQSFNKNAYCDNEIIILKTLAAYISIAIDNSQAYQQIGLKNSMITSSINAALLIQQAILPDFSSLSSMMAGHFVIYRPKDIVSGDFYWANQADGKLFIAVIDCTGHGVPGAFMSMIGNALLNQIIHEKKIYEPANILEHLDQGVRQTLKQHETKNTNGMDLSLCAIEKESSGNYKIEFAGVNSVFYYLPAGADQISTISGSRRSIGGINIRKHIPFTSHHVALPKGSTFYFATDGYKDQNNKFRKRIGSRHFLELLNHCASLPITEQREKLETELDNWMQDEEQRDDITILGIQL